MARFKREFWLLSVFTGIALAYAVVLQESILWFLFYLSLACIILALLYRGHNMQRLKIIRTVLNRQTELEAGSNLYVRLTVETTNLLPWPWIELKENLPTALEGKITGESGGYMVWAKRKSWQSIAYTVEDAPRGIYKWQWVEVKSGDPLGLVSHQGQVKSPGQVVIYPRTVPLEAKNFFPRRAEGVLSVKSQNRDLAQLVGVRDYRPGDKLSLIHWKSVAKNQQLYTKEFAPQLMDSSLIILDCSAQAWATGAKAAFEEAVTVAASLVKAAWIQRIPVSLYDNFHPQAIFPVTSRGEFDRMRLHLAGVFPRGRQPVNRVLFNNFLQGSNIVLVSSGVQTGLQKMLYPLAARGNAITLIQILGGQEPGKSRLHSSRVGGGFNVFQISKAEDLSSPGREVV